MEEPNLGQRIDPDLVQPHLSAWIDPEGNVYHVPECKHWKVAELLGSRMDTLEAKGWMHLSYGNIYSGGREPTQAQLDALFVIELKVVRRASPQHLEAWNKTFKKYFETT